MPFLYEKTKRSELFLIRDEVLQIKQEYGKPALMKNQHTFCAGCIGCVDPPCMRYSDSEIGEIYELPNFSYERSYEVCPVNAMSINDRNGTILIDTKKCLNCGLCADRCPVGAIYYDGYTRINKCDSEHYKLLEFTISNAELQKRQIEKICKMGREKKYRIESNFCFRELYYEISQFDGRSLVQNILVRNILIAMGYNCAISRTGDVYTRMDGVYTNRDCFGVMEIEFGRDTLEASRGILDDVAVLESRFGINKEDNTPVVICLSLPNKRQGYFQVVKDIKKVLNMKIQTITLGALLILLWNGRRADFSDEDFYADFDDMSIRKNLENLLGRKIVISNCFMGILEPEK